MYSASITDAKHTSSVACGVSAEEGEGVRSSAGAAVCVPSAMGDGVAAVMGPGVAATTGESVASAIGPGVASATGDGVATIIGPGVAATATGEGASEQPQVMLMSAVIDEYPSEPGMKLSSAVVKSATFGSGHT